MKKQTLFLVAGLVLNTAVAQTKNELTNRFDQLLDQAFKPDEPGVTVLVAQKGQVIYKKAAGMANLELKVPLQPDHVFRIGSITKQFTAVAILQLMEQGKLNLQDEITRFIPDYPTQGNKITIEHLLTHTSGIHSYTSMKDYEDRMALDLSPTEMIDHFKNEPMDFAPGTKWNYSNSGYFLLGYIIEKASGKTYGEYIEENIFRPLGMTNSYYGSNIKLIPNRVGAYSKTGDQFTNASALSMTQPYGAGSIQSTVEDLYKWNQALHAYQVVKKENLEKAFTSYKLPDGTETGYGYGWSLQYIQGSATFEHGGGINGSLTMGIYLPKEDVFVAVFSNCDCYEPGTLAAKLAAMAIGRPYEYTEINVDAKTLQQYTGVYENGKGEQRIITVSENKLYSQRNKGPKYHIKAYEKNKFYFDEEPLTFEFTGSKKGKVDQLVAKSRSGNTTWTKTNKPIPAEPKEKKVDAKILETYVGEYQVSPDFWFVVTHEEEKLFVQATGQQKIEIFAETDNRFFLKVVDAQLEFVKDGTGKVVSAILFQNGQKIEAKKVK